MDAFKEAAEDDSDVIGEIDTSNENLIDPIWGEERPPVPKSPFRVHPMEYAGVSREMLRALYRYGTIDLYTNISIFRSL